MKVNLKKLFKKSTDHVEVIKLNNNMPEETKDTEEKSVEKNSDFITQQDTTVCPKCKQEFSKQEIKDNLNVCVACGHHFVISADKRMKSLVDKGTFKPLKC